MSIPDTKYKKINENDINDLIISNKTNIKIVKYDDSYKKSWDQFIDLAKNGHFMFKRDYMEYHSDRFKDFSLIIFDGKKIAAVIPANIESNKIISHGGLTFGGIISNKKMDTPKMLEIFEALIEFLKENKIEKFIYKAIPYIYHNLPSQEDLYALFINNATLIRRDISSCIYKEDKLNFNRNKKRNIKKSKFNGLNIEISKDFKSYMKIKKEDLLKKYGITPVHTGDEISVLAGKFPENIKLFEVKKDHETLAGVIIFETPNVAHAQYLASTDEGKKEYAADLLFDYLINNYYKDKKYFSFGISTEMNGFYLNKGLIRFKEQFGARSIINDFYEINLI